MSHTFRVEQISWADIESRVRSVRLCQTEDGVDVHPYADATIQLRRFRFEEIRPTSLYVVTGILRQQSQLTADLSRRGQHPQAMKGGICLTDERRRSYNLFPPFVEETAQDGPYILDGLHRAYVWRSENSIAFNAIYITDFNPAYPAYAFPNEWREVRVYDEVPAAELKHRYREEDHERLRRDLHPLNGSHARS